jgi:P2 family phage major capsid protein
MRNETRQAFNAYLQTIAQLNGVGDVTTKFAASPSVQQRLETRMQESSDFLARINVIGVAEQQGEKLGLGVGGPIARRTDTASGDRPTSDPTSLDQNGYVCKQTNYDTHLTYAKLDAWAKFPNFQALIRDVIVRRMALDRIMIGFNGSSAAATTDPVANALLQDVNIGWIKKWLTDAPARVMTGGATAGSVKVGATGDYKNLDALVFDAVNNLIDPWYQEDTALVAILSRDLLADKYFPLINTTQDPSEKIAADLIISQKRVGGLQAVRVPFVPANTLVITTLDNLSIYFQEGARRRTIVDNAKRDRIENYESSNDAFVVEDYGRGCVVQNITLV